MKEYYIGIDIGTGSTKAIAVDSSNTILTSSRSSYPILSPQPSYIEQEPSAILRAFIECINTITTTVGWAPKAISLSSAMHSLIPVDEEGTALMNMISWADNRSEEVAARLKKSTEGRMIYEKGGTPIHAMTPICKIIWLKEQEPGLFKKTYKFISIKEYIWFFLVKKFEIDYSIASATGLFNIASLQWNDEALNYAGISAGSLSAPVNTSHVRMAGASVISALGIDDKTQFVIGASDGCLANLGSLALKPGTASLTIGTSGAIRVMGKLPVYNYETMPFNYRLDEKTFVSGGPVNNGGVALKWYSQKFLQLKMDKEEDYDLLLDQVELISAGCEGLIFLPYLLGERAPLWSSSACGVFFGITSNHHQASFTRAVLEGISMSLFSVAETMENRGLEIDIINVSGGAVKSDIWLQLLADIFGKETRLVNAEDASARGAVYLAMKALGEISDYNHFETAPIKVFVPDKTNHEIYRKKVFPRFRRLYAALKEEMTALHEER